MKKNVTIIFLFIIFNYSSFAQQKNSFAIGAEWPFVSRPVSWRAHIDELNYRSEKLPLPWIGYYYKNKFSAIISLTYFEQDAWLKEDYPGSEFYLMRDMLSVTAYAGYNFLQFQWKQKGYLLNKIDCWVYAGPSYFVNSYTDFGPLKNRYDNYKNIIRPSGRLMVKYNYAKYGFVSLSGSYHYVSKHTQPFVFGIGVGFQL